MYSKGVLINMRIILTRSAHAKIMAMYNAVESEVGALASGYIHPTSKDVVITNIYITDQEVTAADVDFTEKGVDEATLQALMNKEVIVGWVHSHGKMKPFWSGTDEKSINLLLGHTDSWLVSIVGNHACELIGRVDYFSNTPFGTEHMKINNVQIDLEPDISPELLAEIDLAIKTNVKPKKFLYQGTYGKWTPKNGGQVMFEEAGDTKNRDSPSEEVDKFLFDYYLGQGYSEEEAAGLVVALDDEESVVKV